MNTADEMAVHQMLGTIVGKLEGQDKMLDRNLEETQEIRRDNAQVKTALTLMSSRIDSVVAKQDAMEAKVGGLKEQVSNIVSAAALIKLGLHWGPVTGAATLTAALCREWIMKKLGLTTTP